MREERECLSTETHAHTAQAHSRVFVYEAGQIEWKLVRPTSGRTIDIASENVKLCFDTELLVGMHERTMDLGGMDGRVIELRNDSRQSLSTIVLNREKSSKDPIEL